MAPVAALDGITSCMVDVGINEAATSAHTWCACKEKVSIDRTVVGMTDLAAFNREVANNEAGLAAAVL